MSSGLKRWKGMIIHPFVFAALPIVACLSEVKQLVLPEEIIPVLILTEASAALLFAVASVLWRSVAKGALTCTLAIGFFFSYRLITAAWDVWFQSLTGRPLDPAFDLIIFAALSAICMAAVFKKDWNFGQAQFQLDHEALNQSLNVISVLLLLFNSFPLIQFEIKDETLTQKFVNQFKTAFDHVHFDRNAPKPDVYYIIVDGFANRLTMKNMYHCDYDRLYKWLSEQGFYVVPKAASNYDRTEFSVSSSLNMQYIDAVPAAVGKDFNGLNLFCRMIQDSAVRRAFKQLGYKMVNVSSGDSATDWIFIFDQNIRCTIFNHFMVALAQLTPFSATEQYFPALRNLVADIRTSPGRHLKEIVEIPGPKFVLLHTDLAHAPCLFDESGQPLPLPPGMFMVNWGTPEKLAGQWKFAQNLLVDWLAQIMSLTNGKAVVIIQSDHGSGISMAKTEDWFNERMRILNAYYFPGKKDQGLYPTITPVNSFRVLFNDYFDARLPLLPDKVFCPPDYSKPFDWLDVKDKLNFAERTD